MPARDAQQGTARPRVSLVDLRRARARAALGLTLWALLGLPAWHALVHLREALPLGHNDGPARRGHTHGPKSRGHDHDHDHGSPRAPTHDHGTGPIHGAGAPEHLQVALLAPPTSPVLPAPALISPHPAPALATSQYAQVFTGTTHARAPPAPAFV